MGFSYNDTTSESMGIRTRLNSWQVCGALRNSTITIPGKYGVADFGTNFDYREIKISCCIPPQGKFKSLVTALDNIAAWLDPTNGLKQLVLGDLPDRYFMARLNKKIDCERLLIRSAGAFELSFFAPDPFGYAIDDDIFIISTVGKSSIQRTKGNISSNPIYRLKGKISASRGYISVATNGGSPITISKASLSPDETLVIDAEKMTAWVEAANGEILRNALTYLKDLNFPALEAGGNQISVETDNADFISLEIQAKSRWR